MKTRKPKKSSYASRRPVTEEVGKHLPTIARLFYEGKSQATVFKELTRAGHPVGASPSSFNYALRHHKPALDELQAQIRANQDTSLPEGDAIGGSASGLGVTDATKSGQSDAAADTPGTAMSAPSTSAAVCPEGGRPLVLICANDAGGQFSTTLARVLHTLFRLASSPTALIDANPGSRKLSDYYSKAAKLPDGFRSDHVPSIVGQVGNRNVIIDVGCNAHWLDPNGSDGLAALVEGLVSVGHDCFCYLSVTPSKPGNLIRLAQIAGRFPRAKPIIVLNEWYLTDGMDPTDPGYPHKSKYPYPIVELGWMGTANFNNVEKIDNRSLYDAVTQRGLIGDYCQATLIERLRDFADMPPHRASFTSAVAHLDRLDASIPWPRRVWWA